MGACMNWSCIFRFALLIRCRREGDGEFGRDGVAGIGNSGVTANRLPMLSLGDEQQDSSRALGQRNQTQCLTDVGTTLTSPLTASVDTALCFYSQGPFGR